MDGWNEHEVVFAPAEGLEKNETTVRVLDHDIPKEDRIQQVEQRAHLLDNDDPSYEQILDREQLMAEVHSDPGYKFIMKVAAFSSRKIGKMVYAKKGSTQPKVCDVEGICSNVGRNSDWILEPEITGVVHLSVSAYGHIKEAETILRNGWSCVPLKRLVEDERYSTLFARLVAIRMSLSSCLSSAGYRLDRTFQRLHQEQTMVLRALRKVSSKDIVNYNWVQPIDSYNVLSL